MRTLIRILDDRTKSGVKMTGDGAHKWVQRRLTVEKKRMNILGSIMY